MNFLLINANNTNTTFALANRDRILARKVVPTAKLKSIPFRQSDFAGAILSSVVPAATRKLRHCKPIIVSADIDLGIGIRYPYPTQIGADRLANAVGVSR